MLFRTNDRHPEDETILVINDPEDFKLIHEWQKLKIRGLTLDMQLTEQVTTEALEYAHKVLEKRHAIAQKPFPWLRKFLSGDPTRLETNIHPKIGNSMDRARLLFEKRGIQENFGNELIIASEIFANAMNANGIDLDIRVNSTFPTFFHTHKLTDMLDPEYRPFMTLSFNQAGTEFLNEAEEPVVIPAGILTMLKHNVQHRAKQASAEKLIQSPRVNCIISMPN